MKEIVAKLKAMRAELDAIITEVEAADEIQRIEAAQASVPESNIK